VVQEGPLGRRQPPRDLLVEDDEVTRRALTVLAPILLAAALLTGCSDGGDVDTKAPATASTTAPVAAPAPPVHACYNLTVAAALQLSSNAPKVPCTGRHTAITISVGRIDPVSDGHLLAIDSARLQRQIAHTCMAKVDSYVGGSLEARRLSRVQAVWFSPTAKQSESGALWFRCDLVIAGTRTAFATLPAKTRGLLSASGALNRFGTCGTASPAAQGFERVACAAKHSWRVRASIDLPAGAKYLDKAAGKRADSTCRDIEAGRATTLTTLRWSFEWPTKTQWQNGQRYGLCWTPDA
jgi:hypothetical protein